MIHHLRRIGGLAVLAAAVLSTAACASTSSSAVSEVTPSPVEYEVTGTLHITEEATNICAVELQSYPPQCGAGVPVAGLDAVGIPSGLIATHSGVSWGFARLVGTYEDGTLTLTREPERPPRPDPAETETETIPTESAHAAELATIAESISRSGRPGILTVGTNSEGVEVLVPLETDDTLQDSLDAKYGAGVVVVTSWLRPLPGVGRPG